MYSHAKAVLTAFYIEGTHTARLSCNKVTEGSEPGVFTGHDPARGSNEEVIQISRVGSGRVGSGHPYPTLPRPDPRGLTRPVNSDGYMVKLNPVGINRTQLFGRGGGYMELFVYGVIIALTCPTPWASRPTRAASKHPGTSTKRPPAKILTRKTLRRSPPARQKTAIGDGHRGRPPQPTRKRKARGNEGR